MEKSRALVLSGGGSKGSWQAGVVKTLADVYPEGFDVISGTSVGAINAAGLAMFPKKDFRDAAKWLESRWKNDLSIWKYKFPRYLAGLWSNSLGSNKALKRFLGKHMLPDRIRSSGVKLILTAVDIETGFVSRFTENSDDLIGAVLASSSFPVMFPMQQIGSTMYTDGGVRDIAPLSPAIRAGVSEVVVVTTTDPYRPDVATVPKNALKMLARVIDLMATEIILNDVNECKRINKSLENHPTKRAIDIRLIYPSKTLGDSLDFGKDLMRSQFRLGMEDAAGYFVGDL